MVLYLKYRIRQIKLLEKVQKMLHLANSSISRINFIDSFPWIGFILFFATKIMQQNSAEMVFLNLYRVISQI